MIEPRGQADLAEESVPAKGFRQVRVQDLERHLAIVLEVTRQVYGRHPAAAELALDAVAVGKCVVEFGHGVGK